MTEIETRQPDPAESDETGAAVAPESEESFIISVENLGKRYKIGKSAGAPVQVLPDFGWAFRRITPGGRRKVAEQNEADTLWALKDINFTIRPGERVGVIGRNGAGKSTLLKVLSRVTYPTVGRARVRGRLTALLEVGTGFSEVLTGRENIYLNANMHGLGRAEVDERVDEIIDFAEVRRFIDTPLRFYSSGMRSRLAFAVAAHLEPDALLLDEVLAVGDIAFQKKCLERMQDITKGSQALIFVSHSMDSVIRYCDRCLWIDAGRLRMDGPAAEVTEAYVGEVMGQKSHMRLPDSVRRPPPPDQ